MAPVDRKAVAPLGISGGRNFQAQFLYCFASKKDYAKFWQASAQTTTTTLRLHTNHASLLYIKYELIARGALPMFWTLLVRLLPSYLAEVRDTRARATVADFGTFRVRGTGTRYGLTVLTTLGAELRGEPQERYHSTNSTGS